MMKLRSNKRYLSTAIHSWFVLTLTIAAAACGRKGGGEKQVSGKPFRVALLTPGPVSDQGWNAGAYQGLLRIRDSLGAKISSIETKTPAEIENNFRQYGAQGYDLVIGHGFEFQDPAIRVSPEFPNTAYAITSGSKTGQRVASIEFSFREGAYLAGIVAGAATKSGTIGVIGGTELPPVVEAFKAFEAGAKSMNPRVVMLSSYIGNWDDVSAAKEQALAQISRGADVIFQNADNAGLGVFQAAREKKTVRVLGANANQNDVAPEVTLGSVVIDVPHALLMVARMVKDATFAPRVITLGEKAGVVQWVPNPQLAAEIAPTTTAAVDSITRAIRTGTFTIPR